MDRPSVDNRPLRPSDQMHVHLAERGSALFPEVGNEDGRFSLSDAMLAVAALACCFAAFRESIGLGFVSILLVLPALARTHVVMIQGREEGTSPNLGTWTIAFGSSIVRVGLILGPCSLTFAASLMLGGFLGHRLVVAFLGAGSRFAGFIEGMGGLLMAFPTTLLVLAYLAHRLMPVRERD